MITPGPAGFDVVEHEFELPLDHACRSDAAISVFAREVAAPDGRDKPLLVYFEGGPGHEDPRPMTRSMPVWVDRALKDYRVLFLDQRGTGRSTPVGPETLRGRSAREQADYLRHFRADSIVRDAEAIREALGIDRWTVLGQSFGAFCVLRYLSAAPDGLVGAMTSGGLPAVGRSIDQVYRATYASVREKTSRYLERYPSDEARLAELLRRVESREVVLPSGELLGEGRVRQFGFLLGMFDGFERLHYLLERPFESPGFLHDVERVTPFTRNPIYAVLHEACWADGFPTRWSAHRLLDEEPATLLTGEHIFPWMFSEFDGLAPYREVAHLLAEEPWERLYDESQLRQNDVQVAAAIYVGDMYVPRSFSEETASLVRGLRPWITNEHEHDGLSTSPAVFERLLDLIHNRAR